MKINSRKIEETLDFIFKVKKYIFIDVHANHGEHLRTTVRRSLFQVTNRQTSTVGLFILARYRYRLRYQSLKSFDFKVWQQRGHGHGIGRKLKYQL